MSQNDGTLVGSPAFVAAATGFGQQLSLTGNAGQYVSIPEPGPFDFGINAAWFVSVRVQTTNTSSLQIALGDNYAAGRGWWIGSNNGVATASAGSGTTNINGSNIADGNPHTLALAMTANNGMAYFFVDGNLAGTQAAPNSAVVGGTQPAVTAIGQFKGQYAWNGQIDEVAVYNFAKYTASYTAPTAPTSSSDTGLVALYHLDSTAADSSVQAQAALAAPALSAIAANAAGVTLTWAAATGGTAPYTYQAYGYATSGTAPASGNALSGQTTLTTTDTSGTAGIVKYYKLVVTDSTGATATSLQAAAARWYPDIKILFIGDSITAAYNLPTVVQAQLQLNYPLRNVDIVNAGVSGSPSTAWTSGSTNLVNAKNAAVSAFGAPSVSNPVYAMIMLGVNDDRVSTPGNTPAQYTANMQSALSDLVAAGYVPILNDFPSVRSEPQPNSYDTDAGFANAQGYRAALDTLADNKTVFRGDTTIFAYMANHLELFNQDGSAGNYTYVHPNAAGQAVYGAVQAAAFMKVVGIQSVPASTHTVTYLAPALTHNASSQPVLTWPQDTAATAYLVVRSIDNRATYQVIANLSAASLIPVAGMLSYTDQARPVGGTDFYHVVPVH